MRYLLPLIIAITGIAAANATAAHLEGWVASEQIELCHRQGGTPETCGDLVMDDLP